MIFGIQAILLGILLIKKTPVRSADRFLALLLFFFAGMCINLAWYNFLTISNTLKWYSYIQFELYLGIGPSLYFFAKSVTERNFQMKKNDWWHFLPVVLEFIYFRTGLYREGFMYRMEHYNAGYESMYAIPFQWQTLTYMIVQWSGNISALIYTSLVFVLIKRHESRLKDTFSNLEGRSMKWLLVPIYFYGGFWLVWIVLRLADQLLFDNQYKEYYHALSFVGLSAITCWIGFKGYVSKYIGVNTELVPIENKSTVAQPELAQKVLEIMEKEKPFLDPDLDLGKLSEMLNINMRQLSQAINHDLNTNFYELINRYRVEEFKKRVISKESTRLSLIGVAFDCGFSSKSTFNHVFKKMTGQTPKEFTRNTQK